MTGVVGFFSHTLVLISISVNANCLNRGIVLSSIRHVAFNNITIFPITNRRTGVIW